MAEQRSPDAIQESERRVDTFVNIKGITGESTDLAHRDWIEVLRVTWGVRQPAGTGGAGVGTGERADFDDVVITKVVDRSSPTVYRYCAQGTHITKVRIEMCEQAGSHVNFLTFILEDVVVAGARLTGAITQAGVPRPIEDVAFRYGKIEWQYVPVSHDGERGSTVIAGYDLLSNMPK
jgi:type VI secretion system secreted protein Hcp